MNELPYDREAAIRAIGGGDILAEVAIVYLEEVDGMLERVENAISARDYKELREAAHWIKGGMVYLHAAPAAQAAKALEVAAKEPPSSEELDRRYQDLQSEMERLRSALLTES